MELCILGSGSRGNACWLRAGDTKLLVDAGIPFPELKARADGAGIVLDGLSAIVVTHAHCDHAAHAEAISLALDAPLYLTPSTRRGMSLRRASKVRVVGYDAPFSVGGVEVTPIPVPHDAPQTALLFRHQGYCAGLATDLGSVPAALISAFQDCSAILLESNYDPDLLAQGPYPPSVQARVRGSKGHLSNGQAATLLRRLFQKNGCQLREVVLVHLSEANNEPAIAQREAEAALSGRGVRVRVAPAAAPFHLSVPRVREQLTLPHCAAPLH